MANDTNTPKPTGPKAGGTQLSGSDTIVDTAAANVAPATPAASNTKVAVYRLNVDVPPPKDSDLNWLLSGKIVSSRLMEQYGGVLQRLLRQSSDPNAMAKSIVKVGDLPSSMSEEEISNTQFA